MRKALIASFALAALLGLAAPAQARDTTWGCPTCLTTSHH